MTGAATTAPRALRVSPPALRQRVGQQLRQHRAGPRPVLLIGAEPVWPFEPDMIAEDGARMRVVPCGSVLAVWEQLTAWHRAEPAAAEPTGSEPVRAGGAQARASAPAGGEPSPTEVLVLLTDLPERELGVGVLTGAFRQRIIGMEPWDLVAETFGAQALDTRLKSEGWAGEALLDAMPPEGWPRLSGTMLGRDHAFRLLATVRLGLDRLGLAADDLDAAALLRWTTLPGAADAVAALRPAEREGLLSWLASEYGRPARLLVRLYEAGHIADALPLGLVCAAVWSVAEPEALRAQGRIEQYFGNGEVEPATVCAFAETATRVVEQLLRAAPGDTDHRTGTLVLDRAEELLLQFGAMETARHSTTLRTGFAHRADAVATAITTVLADPAPQRIEAATATVAELADHILARWQPHRVERAEMALRLAGWLATGTEPPGTVADGISGQITGGGWVDLALAHVWAGEDSHPGLQQAFRTVYERAARRRRELDRVFAERLADWTAAGTPSGSMLTVEQVLDQVVAPLVRTGERPVLLVVLDGMSAAAAVDLAEDLTRQHWLEYDPLANGAEGRRRAALAAVPSVTDASRASLLTGTLRRGGAEQERAGFETHPRWKAKPARLFHKGSIAGGAGEVLDDDLEAALGDRHTLVGVVLNTIDDALYQGREGFSPGWRIDQIGQLRSLLDHARYHGRAVVITSDHGHVLERGSSARAVTDAASARHRTDAAPPTDGEVELSGPRVVPELGSEQRRVVALWDPDARYLPRRAGYHGGASLAEMTVPVLAFLRLGAATPPGWAPLEPQQHPHWWTGAVPGAIATPEAPLETGPEGAPPPRQRKATGPKPADAHPSAPEKAATTPKPAGDTLFELPEPRTRSLVEAVLESETFASQHTNTPRKVPLPKIRGALAALVDANGVLPTVVVAQRAGELPGRAHGFARTLQQVFNVDSYSVLSLVDDGRTLRLDLTLLREQFGIPGSVR